MAGDHQKEVSMKVIDAFLFSGELDILEIRLNELDSVVDHFVIEESCEPHGAGGRRQPTYLANPARWAEVIGKFGDKIHYEVLDKLEPVYTDSKSGWQRENFHRSALMQPIRQLARPEDVVIVSDVDEIPRASVLKQLIPQLNDRVIYLQLGVYRYNVNTFDREVWAHSYVTTMKTLEKAGGPQPLRGNLDMPAKVELAVNGAGWHFTSFMDVPRLREKLKAFAHSSDFPHLNQKNDQELLRAILKPENIFNGKLLERLGGNEIDLPKYFLDNRKKFRNLTREPLEELCPRPFNIYGAMKVPGFIREAELEFLAEQASKHNKIVEIGSWIGCSTRALADNCPGTVLAVDTWRGTLSEPGMVQFMQDKPEDWLLQHFLRNTAGCTNITTHRNESWIAAELLKNEEFDMIFIDASHDYDNVKRDILAWGSLLAPGGLLCGHDYHVGTHGVIQAVDELLDGVKVHDSIWYIE